MATPPRRPQYRAPRLSRARPKAPSLGVVAEAAMALARIDPANPLVAYARSRPDVAGRLLRLEALAYVERLGSPAGELDVMPISMREHAAARRFEVGTRSVRRWRTGR